LKEKEKIIHKQYQMLHTTYHQITKNKQRRHTKLLIMLLNDIVSYCLCLLLSSNVNHDAAQVRSTMQDNFM
jgi:hypothetical protein